MVDGNILICSVNSLMAQLSECLPDQLHVPCRRPIRGATQQRSSRESMPWCPRRRPHTLPHTLPQPGQLGVRPPGTHPCCSPEMCWTQGLCTVRQLGTRCRGTAPACAWSILRHQHSPITAWWEQLPDLFPHVALQLLWIQPMRCKGLCALQLSFFSTSYHLHWSSIYRHWWDI